MAKGRTPFILDYTQSASEIIREFLEFDKMQNFTVLSYNNYSEQTNEFKEKTESSLKLGSNLLINNLADLSKVYYQFSNIKITLKLDTKVLFLKKKKKGVISMKWCQ